LGEDFLAFNSLAPVQRSQAAVEPGLELFELSGAGFLVILQKPERLARTTSLAEL